MVSRCASRLGGFNSFFVGGFSTAVVERRRVQLGIDRCAKNVAHLRTKLV